jgi:hypothetical protein
MSDQAAPEKVTRDDIEAKLRELRGDIGERVETVKLPAIAIAVGAVVATVVVAYWLGRRRGKRKQMVLEIRRI